MRKSSHFALLVALVFFSVPLFAAVSQDRGSVNTGTAVKTGEKKTEGKLTEQKKAEEKKPDLGEFTFTTEGRRDPFQPVLLQKAKASRNIKNTKTTKKDAPEALGYELEELRLVGVMKSDKGMIAMMEDTQGKGIFFRKGEPLKENMWVADITTKGVVLAYKLKGEIKKIVVDMPTPKEKGGL